MQLAVEATLHSLIYASAFCEIHIYGAEIRDTQDSNVTTRGYVYVPSYKLVVVDTHSL
jgi:hypothetical protein